MGRSAIVFATTMFKAVCYSQDESQIITAGTDRKVSHTTLSDSSNLFMQKRTVSLQTSREDDVLVTLEWTSPSSARAASVCCVLLQKSLS